MTDDGVLKNATSRFRRVTSPGSTWPPPFLHFGSSSEATVLGSSPAFSLEINPEPLLFPQPILKAQETSAPYWFSLRITVSTISAEMHD